MNAAADTVVKFHTSLNVSDLARSITFYQVLLGITPAKVRADYAKFELAEPPLILSLIPGKPGGNLNHVGLRVRTAEELVEVQRRLEAAGITTRREDGVECCYARQTKFWVSDPDRLLWEIYILHQDIDERGDAVIPANTIGEVPIAAKPHHVWMHRLGEPIPEKVSHDANSVHEVLLEGTLNAKRDAPYRETLFSETFRILRPGGVIQTHGLSGDRSGDGRNPHLPGPAAAVEYVPSVSEIVEQCAAAGFVEIEVETLSPKPYFVVDGIPMREFRIRAKKPGHRPRTATHNAIYRGPLAQVTDDYGNVFRRGELTPLNIHDWQMLSKGGTRDAFVFLEPASEVKACVPTPQSQERRSN